ncbi:F0F1 ATP synthase subunit A [Roseicella sp. DB1501]|uniref:F0F1 ATP synthase subunit A n=1 Tax=Roseicella sp. DB1501 TaxID=2730925 RepID=UPI001492D4AD|nr:F0F1 ATP synthase subunit A [Roseicella sp. DB1501]NOG69081.1 F0F1 ATP synthase subunit A [Roseicella sp. DB1501]
MTSPLETHPVWQLGPVPLSMPVLVTWGLMLVLAGGSWLLTRRLALRPGRAQAAMELVVEAVEQQIRETMRVEPRPYLALIGTFFLFVLTANWSSLIPGIEPPTASIETDAALALIVFVAVILYGLRVRGWRGYLGSFLYPNIIMLPLNLIENFTRTFALMVRLFGNVMSGVFVIGIVLSLVGFLVPVPLMALELLTGAVQAYIFSVLAMVFIGGAVEGEGGNARERKDA